MTEPGSLVVVGTGFMVTGQITPEARAAIAGADRLFHLVSGDTLRDRLAALNPSHESLYDAYGEGRQRIESYHEMVDRVLAPVRAGRRVCMALYGHPGVYVYPSHEAIRRARAEGLRASMLPGISAEDRLYADLELDPAIAGSRSYEATDFLVRARPADPATGLLLWQVGAIGVFTYYRHAVWNPAGVRVLVDTLLESYPADHEVVLYTAATSPFEESTIHRMPLSELAETGVSVASTLYVPPARRAEVDDRAVARLGWPGPEAKPTAPGTTAPAPSGDTPGRLFVVGTGYGVAGQVTPETRSVIDAADRLFYLVTDPATGGWLRERHPHATSLHDCYLAGETGVAASEAMVRRIVEPLAEGLTVCAAFSGHPAIGLYPPHGALAAARAGGHRARMLAAVSFEDCLVADVGVDPGATGRSLWEATDFVIRPRPVDTGAALVLIQIGAIGERTYRTGREASVEGLEVLRDTLLSHDPGDHEVVVYESSQIPVAPPTVVRLPLAELAGTADRPTPVRVASTLYVPPLAERPKDPERIARVAETLQRTT